MSELKTKRNDDDVLAFINSVENKRRREDALRLLEIFNEVTDLKPEIWGGSMIGYGSYHYKSKSGQEGDWFVSGFSPRKQSMTVYIMPGFDCTQPLMEKLGKHKTGRSCLYINKLADVDIEVLKTIISDSIEAMNKLGNIIEY